ncbi:hypothetical protein BJY59DRAFT_251 [Rhodotorula toruloides]
MQSRTQLLTPSALRLDSRLSLELRSLDFQLLPSPPPPSTSSSYAAAKALASHGISPPSSPSSTFSLLPVLPSPLSLRPASNARHCPPRIHLLRLTRPVVVSRMDEASTRNSCASRTWTSEERVAGARPARRTSASCGFRFGGRKGGRCGRAGGRGEEGTGERARKGEKGA